MLKQATYPIPSTPKHPKPSKSNAKSIVKQSLEKLQSLYSQSATQLTPMSTPVSRAPHSIGLHSRYVQVLSQTQQIYQNLRFCSSGIRNSVELGDIIGNNFVLGLKTFNQFMVGGFVYLAAKYLGDGDPDQPEIGISFDLLTNLAHREAQQGDSRAQTFGISSELRLASQAVSSLLTSSPPLHKPNPNKAQTMLQNALNCLCKTMQQKASPSQWALCSSSVGCSFNPQQCFYHPVLRCSKVSKVPNHTLIYKQLLASYFRYLTQHKQMPALDLCKLLLDSIVEDEDTGGFGQPRVMDTQRRLKQKGNFNADKPTERDQDLTGFLIRKCFALISGWFGKSGFNVEDRMLKEAVQACCTVEPYCRNQKNISQIIQTLFQIKKLHLIVDQQYWARDCETATTTSSPTSKQKQSQYCKDSSQQFIKICKYVCSCYLYLEQVARQFSSLSLTTDSSSSYLHKQKYSRNLPELSAKLARNLCQLLSVRDEILTHIWSHIINHFHCIKSAIFPKCNRRHALANRAYILHWSICAEIQDKIITNTKFNEICGNIDYALYQISNLYILGFRHFLREAAPEVEAPHNKGSGIARARFGDKLGRPGEDTEIDRIVERFGSQKVVNARGFKYWDQLVSFGAFLIQNCGDSDSLQRVSTVLKSLMKCKNMVLFAHCLFPSRTITKSEVRKSFDKLPGLLNLLLSLQQATVQPQQEKPEQEQVPKLTRKLSQNPSECSIFKTKSNLNQLKKYEQKIRGDLLVGFFSGVGLRVLADILPNLPQPTDPDGQPETDPNYPPYEDLMGHALALFPALQDGLIFQDRLFITKLRVQFIEKIHPRGLHKCRYIYHKTFAMILQDYSNSIANNTKEPPQPQWVKKTKKILTTYLQSYEFLYPKSPKSPTLSPGGHYTKMLYVDFVQWVLMYCHKKQLQEITIVAEEIMDSWLDGKMLEDYLWGIVKDICERDVGDIDSFGFQLLAECVNKIAYLGMATPRTRNGQGRLAGLLKDGKIQASEEENESSAGIANAARINIQFQLQQASIHISHFYKPLNILSQTCSKIVRSSGSSSLSLPSLLVCSPTSPPPQLLQIRNYPRLLTCLNNVLSIAYSIGYEWSEEEEEEGNVLRNLCMCKLLLCRIYEEDLGVFLKFAEMVFLGYLPRYDGVLRVIEDKLRHIDGQTNTVVKNQSSNSQGKSQTMSKHQSNLCFLIKLYLNLPLTPPPAPFLSSPILKLLVVVQTLCHAHPHKPLLRSISGYIFSQRHLSQQSILKYNQCLLPITYCTMVDRTGTGRGRGRGERRTDRSCGMDEVGSQLQHRILELVLAGLLESLRRNCQVSEFRGVLRLALVYFLRARNMRGILLAINCWQLRTRNLHQGHSNPQPRKSQLQPIPPPSSSSGSPSPDSFPPLDLLHVSDSFCRILSTLYQQKFKKKLYAKYTEAMLEGTCRRRRTSASFHVKIQDVLGLLRDSVGECGSIGWEVFGILGEGGFGGEVRKSCVVYQQYLKLKKKALQNPNYPHPFTSTHKIDLTLCKFLPKMQQGLESVLSSTPPLRSTPLLSSCRTVIQKTKVMLGLLLQELKNIIMHSYYHAQILENFMEYVVETLLETNNQNGNENGNQGERLKAEDVVMVMEGIIVELSVLMLDHNYRYKKMIETVQPISLNHDDDYQSIITKIAKANSTYKSYLTTYLKSHSQTLCYLIPSEGEPVPQGVPHPVTILYPFHSWVYILPLSTPHLITTTLRTQFQQYNNNIDVLISNNSRLLNDKNVDPKDWWKSRDRVDRAIGKIVAEVPIWAWDYGNMHGAYDDEDQPHQATQEERKLFNIVYMLLNNRVTDFRKIKTCVLQTNVRLTTTSLQSTILKATLLQNKQPSLNHNPKNLLLLSHPSYSLFPFQSTPALSSRPVYRIPSIQYMIENIQKGRLSAKYNINCTNYLVNSGNDLLETQRNFYRIKEGFPLWRGIVGRKPSATEFFGLFQREVFLYMGHGNGSGHLREKDFYNKPIQCFMMLFGCSSVSMTLGKCQPNGFSHSNLINGSPGVLGCLWEVTDKDTDKVTQNIFKSLSRTPQNLQKILTASRKKCKHQYLNGGALVIFGMPAYIYSD